eukprot:698190-Pleurochrysis_carterae.AAC.2
MVFARQETRHRGYLHAQMLSALYACFDLGGAIASPIMRFVVLKKRSRGGGCLNTASCYRGSCLPHRRAILPCSFRGLATSRSSEGRSAAAKPPLLFGLQHIRTCPFIM